MTAHPQPDSTCDSTLDTTRDTVRDTVRAAIVGAGYIAEFHLQILAATPGVDVVAVCDVSRDRAEALASRFGVESTCTDVAELASLGVQVAHVLVPPDLHEPVTRRLLEAGIGALVEKPFTLDLEAARVLSELARSKGLPLGVNHNFAFHPAFEKVLKRVRTGELGRVEHVRCCWNLPLAQLEAADFAHWMFRSPRNIVFEQGPHPFSMVHALIGAVRSCGTRILATRELEKGQVFHDCLTVSATAERGTAEFYFAFGQGLPRVTVEVLCTDGSAEASLEHNLFTEERKTLWLDFWNSFLNVRRNGGALKRTAWKNALGYARFTLGLGSRSDPFFLGMKGSIQSFYARLREGHEGGDDSDPRGTPQQAVEVIAWCEAMAQEIPDQAREAPSIPQPGPVRSGEVVVLGGNGFIGRRVVARLVERGIPATVMVRRRHNLPSVILDAAASGALRVVSGSLEDRDSLAAAIEGAATVVHLATGGGETWEQVERAMVGGTVSVAEACLQHGVGRLVYVSSIAALYLGPDRKGEIGDDLQTDPRPEKRDVYTRGKVAAEAALARLRDEKGLPVVVARPGVVVGRGSAMQHGGFGLWVRDNHCIGWGHGETPLPLVWVDDVADALVAMVAYEGHDLTGKALNLCARPPISAADVVHAIREDTGRAVVFHPRALWRSQAMELGKWVVKVVGRRPGTRFPSYRDLKSRACVPPFTSETARTKLGWSPVEEREAFLDAAIRVHGPKASPSPR